MRRVLGIAGKGLGILITAASLGMQLAHALIASSPVLLGVRPVIVLTGSMEPTLQTGGLAFLRPIAPTDDASVVTEKPVPWDPIRAIQVGSIITFRSPRDGHTQISHRVIGIEETQTGEIQFLTKGDNSQRPDPSPVPAENVVGTIVLHVPHVGWVADWARHRDTFMALVGIPVALIVVTELINIARELRRLRTAGMASRSSVDG